MRGKLIPGTPVGIPIVSPGVVDTLIVSGRAIVEALRAAGEERNPLRDSKRETKR
jgi:hypothetical protein